MKIAFIAPIEETVPPQKYGGTEWIVYYLAHELGKRGHTIDLYATGDSKKESYYNLIPTISASIRTQPKFADIKLRDSQKFLSLTDTVLLLQKQNNYDIIHNNYGWRFLVYGDFFSVPIVTTHHGPLSNPYQNLVYQKLKHLPYVSISDNQRKDLPDLNYIATIYNGTDTEHFLYSDSNIGQSSPMLFLARMNDEKGAIEAAQTAHQTKKKLNVAAKIDSVDQPYFEKFKKLIDAKYVVHMGEIGFEKRLGFLQSARCLLAPIKWEEPFGLMFTEAMACGTPVITFARGSVPEIIKDGETGFIVNQSEELKRGNWIIKKTGVDGLSEAVERIYNMPQEEYQQMRKACRAHVEKNFTVERMVDKYEKTYEQILSSRK